MSYWKEVYENTVNTRHEFDIWESGVIDTLHSLPLSVLKDLTKSKELGYYASLVLMNALNPVNEEGETV